MERIHMDQQRLELGEVRLSIVNPASHTGRAERISHLIFENVRELAGKDSRRIGSDVVIDRLEVPPLQVSLDTMDDEAIARASAERIYRALLAAL